MRKCLLLILLVPSFLGSLAQGKQTRAVKVPIAPRIDGSLEDAAWQQAPSTTGFITNSPVFGKASEVQVDIKLVYDNTAIYIGAFIHDDPALVRRQFTARDQEQNANVDYFAVFFDTYADRQNAFQLLVTTRNVQSDARVSPQVNSDFGVYGDLSWDAVWDSKVGFTKDGWAVEMKVPFFSIRFPKKNVQDWGIQFLYFNRRLNETAFWNPVDPALNGFVNQFGSLSGLENLVPPLRLSFSPYLSGGYRSTPTVEGNRNEWLRSGGMDVKYGISESFTLDATLIPDFGQVVSDNIVNNITPYEIQFRDNRPFFTEGTELFNKAGIFYSRRIGDVPGRYSVISDEVKGGSLSNYSIIRNPSVTPLYNAIKFSGRTGNNLGIGVFNAIAQPVHSKLRSLTSGADTLISTEPLANYNIVVLDQALKNRSYITFTNTNVLRDGAAPDANVTALDVAFYDKKNRFGLLISPRYSKIYDSAGGYDGFKNVLQVGRVSGKFQFGIMNELTTAKYDPNDLGFLTAPNIFSLQGNVSYNIFHETGSFLNQRYSLVLLQSYLFKPFEYQKSTVLGSVYWVLKNFWDLTLNAEVQPRWYNDFFELQTPENLREIPRKKLRKAPNYFLGIVGNTDSRKRLFFNWGLGFAESPNPNDPYYLLDFTVRYRFSDKFTVDASFRRQHDHGQFGFSFLRDPVTNEPILARRQYTDVAPVLSGTYNFSSRMNITFRARHFWNRILNTNFYDVKPDGNWVERFDMPPSDHNTNYNAFNLDVFYTWDFRLGSRVIVGWKNWLANDYQFLIDGTRYAGFTGNAGKIFSTPHGNEITVRFIYFLDYQQFVRRRK